MISDTEKKFHIKKSDLVVGAYYFGHCRNTKLARWNGKQFVHWRTKFADTFLETINCPEDDEVFDVFYAMERVTNLEIPI